MGSSEGQTYCLRWNNHKSNLVEILDALIKMECYVDCTIVVDEQVQFKAHRVVLAANSPYFQNILQDVPMDHCSILFPGVKEFEMRALLEYMYTGEVNVTKSQIPRIMKIAEQLEVKGLFEMNDLKGNFGKIEESTSHATNVPHAPAVPHLPTFPLQHNDNNTTSIKTNNNQTSPITSSNNVTSAAQSSSASPPYSSYKPYSNLYSRARSPVHTPATDRPTPAWPIPHLDSSMSSHLSRVYESVADMNPLKRKKLSSISSMLNSTAAPIDTPILRNVLAQSNVADSSQALPLVCPSERERSERSSNGSNGTDYSDKKYHDRGGPIDEPHSPYTDKSFDEDSAMDQSQGYGSDSRIASYVPQQNQKPEWKRYKQYTRNDILSAIECVKNGMSALQASRKFGVPSRTLYDKVKKMGITTGRPMNRSSMKRSPSSGGNSLQFPYGITGASHPYPDMQVPSQSHSHHDDERSLERERHSMVSHPAAALLGQTFLQQALDIRGGDVSLHAMALAAAAHARANGVSTSPGAHGTARSPSPSMNALAMRYMRPPSTEIQLPSEHSSNSNNHRSRKQSNSAIVAISDHHGSEEDVDKVEDLSMSRSNKDLRMERTPSTDAGDRSPSPPIQASTPIPQPRPESREAAQMPPQQGVIVPPLSKVIQQLKERRFEEEYAKERECESTPEIKQELHHSLSQEQAVSQRQDD